MSRILRYFAYEHLPLDLQAVSKPFSDLAHFVDEKLIASEETTAALRKLLEAKDCAVRAALPQTGYPIVPCRTQCGHCGYCTGRAGLA